jgi:hypothetical protein
MVSPMKYATLLLGLAIVMASIIAGHAADENEPPQPTRFQPWQRIWQCNDIRVTETGRQPGIVHYDLGGTIWGGGQFTLNFMQDLLYFNGRPCVPLR